MQQHEIIIVGDRTLTADEIDQILSGGLRLYLYGQVLYQDAFCNDRRTTFRLVSQRNPYSPGAAIRFLYCDEGNEAT